MKTRKYIIIGIILVAAIFGVYQFTKGNDVVPIAAKTITAKKANVTTSVTSTGTIEPITQVDVGTQVSGVVKKIYVDYNSIVKAGQLIAELDKTNLRAAKIQAQAAYDNAVSQRNYMKTIYDRQKILYDNQVISKSDFDEAQYNYQTAKGTATQRLSELQKANTDLGYANIYSPINGVVLSKDIDEGQTVAASYSTPTLFTIAQDLKQMQVEADVDEADIGGVKEGQRVTFTVDAFIGETFEGTVTQVRLDYTETSSVITYTVVIKADNPDLKLKPGLTATVSIYTLELKDVLTTEAKAVNFKPNTEILAEYNKQHNFSDNKTVEGTTLWVLNADKSITQKSVELGASDGVNVQIVKGINEGEKLVYNLEGLSKEEARKSGSSESPFMPKPPESKKK